MKLSTPPARSRSAEAAPPPAMLEPLEARQLLSGGPQILTVGDSITWGSPNPDQSYRRELDRAIAEVGIDAEFVGSRSDGRGFDNDHYSQPGIQATVSRSGNGGVWRGSLNDGFRSGSVLKRGEKPELILLHIGTNTVDGNRSSVDNAAGQLRTLLNTMADRYRRGEFASDVKVLVADIIPGGRGDRSGSGYRLDTQRLENTRSYNAKIGQVIRQVGDRGFASRIQRVDLSKIDASKLDRSAFSSSELRRIDNDGDRWVDWFNGVDEGGSQRNARGHNGAIMSADLLHPTSLGYRVLGQAFFNAVKATGKLGNSSSNPPRRPSPTPSPTPSRSTGNVSIAGATTARVGDTYELRLDDGGRSGGSWYVHWDDGKGQWVKNTDRVTHTFRDTSESRVIRVFHEVDGRRINANRIRVEVTRASSTRPAPSQPQPPATSRPAPTTGRVSISGPASARVGERYELRLDDGGRSGGSWYVHWDDGKGEWLGNTDRASHTFTATASTRVLRVFYEVDGTRTNANRIRLPVTAGGSSWNPAPSPTPAPTPDRDGVQRGDGRVTRDYWTNLRGGDLRDLTGSSRYPGRPTGTTTLDRLRSGHWNNPRDNVDFADRYGERIRGFVVAPETGNYRFWISGDDQASFRLSTDTRTSNLREVARVDGWTKPQQWDKDGRQRSGSIYLVAGRSYALEVLHKEAAGGDHVAVGWRTPSQGGGSRPSGIIGSQHLSSYAV